MTKKTKKITPLMQQYNAIKTKYPEALLLFRVGDFYETFGSDAVKTARILDIILTKRGAGTESETELAGFPHHALNTYLPKLVRAGERVAICDQLEDPIVRRGQPPRVDRQHDDRHGLTQDHSDPVDEGVAAEVPDAYRLELGGLIRHRVRAHTDGWERPTGSWRRPPGTAP